jgi:hypothetical protein
MRRGSVGVAALAVSGGGAARLPVAMDKAVAVAIAPDWRKPRRSIPQSFGSLITRPPRSFPVVATTLGVVARLLN